jgi:ferredoxin
MAIKFLNHDQLPVFLGYLADKARVVAPIKTDGAVQFQPWVAGKDVELDVLLAKQSPKEFVFLQTETYLKFGYTTVTPEEGAEGEAAIPHEAIAVEALNEAPAQVIFGLRPCDARGFVQMDNVFGGYGGFYFDPLYNARRAATTLLAVTCRDPRSTCFCTAIGGCPAGHEGVDALFTQVDGGFTVEAFTGKGEAALAFGGLTDATGAQTTGAAEAKVQATTKVDVPFTLEGIRDNLHDNIAHQNWHDLAMRCISCGTCTYVCPNCYCFSINDELVESTGERYRVWDNCFNPLYTEETSGHNPRAAKSNRFRNRFSHKFWYYPDKYDSLLCSGCGRCIMHCPTRIDIREVLRVMGSQGASADAAAAPAASGAPPAAPAPTDGKEG